MSEIEAQTVKTHIAPGENEYTDGYAEVRECMTCATVQIEMPHLNGICKRCGHKGHYKYAARWVSQFVWWIPRTWGRGFWERVPHDRPGL